MTEHSAEIEAIVRRFTSSIRDHNVEDLPHYFSLSAATTYIGTAVGEIWQGQIVRDGIAAHLAEVPDFTESDVQIDAFENGSTGWATYQSKFKFHSTGATGTHRATFVFVLEHGAWKLIQHHISEATSNIEKLGIEHTAFADLLTAAEAGTFDFGSEGLATIMFTDIVDSTRIALNLGDRQWLQQLDDHITKVTEIIEQHSGTLVKSLGDGTMSAFPSASNALTAAQAIRHMTSQSSQEPALVVRIGLHTGEVIRSRDDFFGNVVNKAARIAGSTLAGEIRLSDATHLISGISTELDFSEPEILSLKGIPGDHITYLLIAKDT
ncbi:adenylate/guanylate cyclase domain-containing protein [Shimia abyssi]|uniref:Class 3 adenylate cyclase n=1 Tax=Shimia abyssi TaxID=1662395 RepID=A0A2P8FHH9_9RHOB|nr:adenylate/guanylate cyclase domain-containing protein [Shimia abyssi]PSL21136.1 class 3 adenylate cyclase [Shimia abyssi]